MRRGFFVSCLIPLLFCLPSAEAAGTLGDTLLRQMQRENAWLESLLRDVEREVARDGTRLKEALKEKKEDKKDCRTLVCKGRGDAAVLFARLNDALFRASLDAAVLARNYEDEADRVMRDIRFVEADMERSRSAMFWRNTFAGLADFASQMAYALATGDATSLEGELAVLAASSTEYAINQQLNGLRGKVADEGGKMAEFAGLPPDVVQTIARDWSGVGLFDVSGGKITGFKPKVGALSDPVGAAGSVAVSKLVDKVIRTGHRIWGGVDFAANYDEKQKMHADMLRNALSLRVAAAFAEAQAKHLRNIKHRFNKLFEREARLIAQCRREKKRGACEAAYRKALADAASRREAARKAAVDAVAEKRRQLARLKGDYARSVERYRKLHDDYFRLRRRWHDARYWAKAENRRELEASAACAQCKEREKARREIAYYKSLSPAAELERQVKAARARLLALGDEVARLEMEVDAAREAVSDARRERRSALFEADQAYARAVREAERRLAQCADVPAPEMHTALGAKAGVKRGELQGFADVMVPVRAAAGAIRRMFGKRAFDWRYAGRAECRPSALRFDFRPMQGVDGCWRMSAPVELMQGMMLSVPSLGAKRAAGVPTPVSLSLTGNGQKGEFRLGEHAFPVEGGMGKDGMLHLVHRFTPESFRAWYANADGGPGGRGCIWDMDALFLRCDPGLASAPVMARGNPRTGRRRHVGIGGGEGVVGIDWSRAYVEWTLKPGSDAAFGRRTLTPSGPPEAHLPTDAGFEASPPMTVSWIWSELVSESAPLDSLAFVNGNGERVERAREGDLVRLRATGSSVCPKVRDTAVVVVRLPGGREMRKVVLRETMPGSGVFLGPEKGMRLELSGELEEARLIATAEQAMLHQAYRRFAEEYARRAKAVPHGRPPVLVYTPTVRGKAAALSASVLVVKNLPDRAVERRAAMPQRRAIYSYNGSPFTARVLIHNTMPGGVMEQRGRLFMRPGAWRMEMRQPGMPESVSIYREDKRLQWTLFPHTRTYMEHAWSAPRLKFAGRETLDGVPVRKYRYEQGSFRGWEWRDTRGIPVRRELRGPCGNATCRMTMRLTDIRVKPSLDDALFEIPAGYAPMATPLGGLR